MHRTKPVELTACRSPFTVKAVLVRNLVGPQLTSTLHIPAIICNINDRLNVTILKCYMKLSQISHTGKKLMEIGLHFGVGEARVSLTCRRAAQKIETDKKLNKD